MNKKLKRLYLPHLRLILALVVNLLTLLETLEQIGWLHPWLFPERRSVRVHSVGERRQPIRPIQFLTPVVLAQIVVFGIAFQLPAAQALTLGAVGNLVIVAVVMLPSISKMGKIE